MSRYYDDFSYRPYVSVAARKAKAAKKAKALQKEGYVLEPVDKVSARGKIATSFWGHAWCRHLESFSDYDNRLPRGRSYVRNGSVLHLAIESGKVTAMVQGSELYELTIRIDHLDAKTWNAVKKSCQGKIGSLIELLQGKISDEIMRLVTDRDNGLFPHPKEIHFNCNCPDWADMCKHVAAVMYGVGARLDAAPELLFKLRGVDHSELIALDTSADISIGKRSGRRRTLAPESVNALFGIDDEDAAPAPRKRSPTKSAKSKVTPSRQKTVAKKTAAKKKKKKAGPFKPTGAAVRKLRESLKLSPIAFAREVGVTVTTVYNWEKAQGAIQPQSRSLSALKHLHGKLSKGTGR